MNRELAQELLRLGFTESDHERMAFLSAKSQAGTLTDDERNELDTYIETSHLIALLQSKARISLKSQGPDSDAPR